MIDDIFDRLFHPFEPQEVHWRVGSIDASRGLGLAFAYVDARDVMDRLDVVVGPQGWQCRYSHADGKTVCELGLRVAGEWLWKADGAGDTEVEAEKGALSDAFKRAAVRWGIGRYIYGIGPVWVALEPGSEDGSSLAIAAREFARLRRLLGAATGIPRKSSAQAKRDGDFEYWSARLEAEVTLEGLGALGRDLKRALPNLPHAFHEPLENAYLLARERILGVEWSIHSAA
jgi:hypothetical protein